ncbi:MAG TPA: hypothetical protein VL576_03800 [Candidatus Paceibacterota bacterium]|jgi:hypothetical protein|nr:hypothetical protein [Candidatus Paceibacterota bacterium]
MDESRKGPSKQFLIRGGIALGIILVILIVQTNWFRGFFTKKSGHQTPQAVGDLIAKDSNGNGIPDWEERLWGLDPTVLYTDGKSNVEIIKEKEAAAGIKPDTNNATQLTETDQLAQSLFSLTSAVGQSNDINSDATIENAAANLGANVPIGNINDHYYLKDIKTIKTTPQSVQTYQKQLAAIISTYDPNTADINVVVQALQTGDFSGLGDLVPAAATYRSFADKIAKVPVPISIAQSQLDIMNGFYGMADSFQYLVAIQNDGIQGLTGIVAYRKYDLMLESALTTLHAYFVQYGILSS